MNEEKNKVNIKSPDEIVISETETVVEPAKTKPAAEPKLKKRVGLGILVTIFILLLIGGALAVGYLWGNNTSKSATTAETNNSTTSNEPAAEPENNKSETATTETTESFKPLTFNADAIVNSDANQSYRVSISDRIGGNSDGGPGYALYASADSNSGYNKVDIHVYWSDINKYYGSNHPIPEGSSAASYENFDVHFSQPVVDIYIGGIGQMIGNESIFYLMEDGTVEKTDIRTAAETGDFTSHAKIDGLEKIVKFYNVAAGPSDRGVGGYHTSAAQDINGKIYLLFHMK